VYLILRDNVEWDDAQLKEAQYKIQENSRNYMDTAKSGNLTKTPFP
jgi:hypothetical protein